MFGCFVFFGLPLADLFNVAVKMAEGAPGFVRETGAFFSDGFAMLNELLVGEGLIWNKVGVEIPLLVWCEGAIDAGIVLPVPGEGVMDLEILRIGEARHRCF